MFNLEKAAQKAAERIREWEDYKYKRPADIADMAEIIQEEMGNTLQELGAQKEIIEAWQAIEKFRQDYLITEVGTSYEKPPDDEWLTGWWEARKAAANLLEIMRKETKCTSQ